MADPRVAPNCKRRRLLDAGDTPPPHGQRAGPSPQTSQTQRPVLHGASPHNFSHPAFYQSQPSLRMMTPPPHGQMAGPSPHTNQTPPPVPHDGASPYNFSYPAFYQSQPSFRMMTPPAAPQVWPCYAPSPQQTVSLEAFKQMEDKMKAQLAKANATIERQDKEIRELKTGSQLNLNGVKNILQSEMTSLVKKDSVLAMNAKTAGAISKLTPIELKEQVKERAPVLLNILTDCIKGDGMNERDSAMAAFLTLSSVANNRSKKANALQLIFALSLISRSTNVQIISLMNTMGVSSSYRTAWAFLSEFAERQRSIVVLNRQEPWLIFFDNVNILKRIGHVRMGTQNEMFNWTSRLAVSIDYEDKSLSREPQGRRQDLLEADVLADSNDVQDLEHRFVEKVKHVLVEHFPSMATFKDRLRTPCSPLPVKKSTIVPLPLLDKDESKKADTIDILLTFAKELNLEDHMKDQA
ncbi:uncharacterized protein LOC118408823 [Branchiostoma floridae]|uniref:Uncharacterized protein LOC118408823 n=1 Tax=Branchiostoma floridae TaxID=7739 RepID=A0A9J7KCQ5_BRAFL|nr:uncharacterized protein LOC118408823 [Branchiostoma floridae]